MDISDDIERLEKQYISEKEKEEKKIKKLLDKKFTRKISSLKGKCFHCEHVAGFGRIFDKKNNKVKRSRRIGGCGKWSERKNWVYLSVENYESRQVSTDCGWGDDDEYALVHFKRYFRACPNCGLMYRIAEETFGESPRWCRNSDDADIKNAKAFIPFGFDTNNGIVRLEKPRKELVEKWKR